MHNRLLAALLIACGAVGLLVSCDTGTDDGFAQGAFPPTLSDTEYHTDSWTRADCLTCHEAGVVEAPKLEHKSLPPVTKKGKCRTCHVFVQGSSAQ